MSKTYSTGELARLANVSVRTVQYYDKRGLLLPSALSEGGRRIYTSADLEKLRVICFLRELDFSIEQVKTILAQEEAQATLDLLLAEHIARLEDDLDKKKEQLDNSVKLRATLKQSQKPSVDSLLDISFVMKDKTNWRKHAVKTMMLLGILIVIFIGVSYLLEKLLGEKANPVIQISISILFIICVFNLVMVYYKEVDYLCPSCHHTFHPKLWQWLFAYHTPKTRRLKCPYCQKTSYCLEVMRDKNQE
ncbi:MerR family transcriptional regulator [Streptococcus sp. zg-JUN1979]|uniref:MerR family transcriptional regulator n=1 Tax=Streptococcus sp. zg-JUN1979 TaxID=3391450 RepID=UPI0039A71392